MSLLFSELIRTQQEVTLFGPAFNFQSCDLVRHFPGLAFQSHRAAVPDYTWRLRSPPTFS